MVKLDISRWPWKIKKYKFWQQKDLVSADDEIICNLIMTTNEDCEEDSITKEQKANNRLLKKSPEILDALIKIILMTHYYWDDPDGVFDKVFEKIDQFMILIEKTTKKKWVEIIKIYENYEKGMMR